MLQALVLCSLSLILPYAPSTQALSVLHIKISLVDAQGKPAPVARHALLVSANPASAAPRLITTKLDGTAEIRLGPGNYTVESDKAVAFEGKTYEWIQTVDVAAGRDAVLELTAQNAQVTSSSASPGSASESDTSFLLAQWQDSVVALWTPSTRASAVLVDPRGLLATNQRVVAAAQSVEVQLTPALKVAGRVLAADRAHDVAVIWIDPSLVTSVRPVPIGCGQPVPPLERGQEIWMIGASLGTQKNVSSGSVSRVAPGIVESDLILGRGDAGGPVFTPGGRFAGLTSIADEQDEPTRGDSPIVPVDAACGVIAAAEKAMAKAKPPAGAPLPMEPAVPFPAAALQAEAKGRAGSSKPYSMTASDFDLAFITPILIYTAQYQTEQIRGRERGREKGAQMVDEAYVRPLMDFGRWSEYVADLPPVLLIRATPRFVEGFWTTVARGAARTQGVALPPIKRFKPGFARMRAFCGTSEVSPIHPFTLEQRVSDTDAIREGLYVFDPGALGPHCESVKLLLYSEKEPDKGDTLVVSPGILQQIWQDFAPYRDRK